MNLIFEQTYRNESKRAETIYPDFPVNEYELIGVLEQKLIHLKNVINQVKFRKEKDNRELFLTLVHIAIVSERGCALYPTTKEEYENYLNPNKE
jgi:DNA polymerase III sliding clamp (beta) subunit (PCNA family)